MKKTKILLMTDSPALDTGFGRVIREIGTALAITGKYDVLAIGWFHHFASQNNKLIPFRVIPTESFAGAYGGADAYGQLTYPKIIEKEQPDIVLVMGDAWMFREIAALPRKHRLFAYTPIDSEPVPEEFIRIFRQVDQLVVFGSYAERAIRKVAPDLTMFQIPHAVDFNVFRPLDDDSKLNARNKITAGANFVVGCVARNTLRKNLPRLIKAFRQFINPSVTCTICGHVAFNDLKECAMCGQTGDAIVSMPAKTDSLLYLHTTPNDQAGYRLYDLIKRFGLQHCVGIPHDLQVGKGISDQELNEFYNAMDVFTLPTTAEGFGLPILEAMSAGTPVLVTGYSAHVEFVSGVGELLKVSEFETDRQFCTEQAIVDLQDYVLKLDRFYYEPEDFIRKWGHYMRACGLNDEQINSYPCGRSLREQMGQKGRERAGDYQWPLVMNRWMSLFDEVSTETDGSRGLAEPVLDFVY